VYLIELGPRNGGNMIPDFLALIHGVDLVGATVEAAMGSGKVHIRQNSGEVYCATYNLHVSRDGIFDSVQYKNGIEDKIIKQVIYKNSGDAIEYFDSANKAIGIVFLKFVSQEELFDFTAKPENWIEVMMK
jgi:hypothetical protein